MISSLSDHINSDGTVTRGANLVDQFKTIYNQSAGGGFEAAFGLGLGASQTVGFNEPVTIRTQLSPGFEEYGYLQIGNAKARNGGL